MVLLGSIHTYRGLDDKICTRSSLALIIAMRELGYLSNGVRLVSSLKFELIKACLPVSFPPSTTHRRKYSLSASSYSTVSNKSVVELSETNTGGLSNLGGWLVAESAVLYRGSLVPV